MGKTAFIVTAGEYSDYRIEGVFSSKPKAEAYVAEFRKERHYDHDISIEEWGIDAEAGKVVRTVWNSLIEFQTGEIRHNNPTTAIADPNQRFIEESPPPWNHPRMIRQSFVSQEHADKLCVESRQKWLRMKGMEP